MVVLHHLKPPLPQRPCIQAYASLRRVAEAFLAGRNPGRRLPCPFCKRSPQFVDAPPTCSGNAFAPDRLRASPLHQMRAAALHRLYVLQLSLPVEAAGAVRSLRPARALVSVRLLLPLQQRNVRGLHSSSAPQHVPRLCHGRGRGVEHAIGHKRAHVAPVRGVIAVEWVTPRRQE